jgi:hypothetical protein
VIFGTTFGVYFLFPGSGGNTVILSQKHSGASASRSWRKQADEQTDGKVIYKVGLMLMYLATASVTGHLVMTLTK